jgi:hypothetical protein
VRERVVEICKQLLEEGIRGESANKKSCLAWEKLPNRRQSSWLPKRQLLNLG